jgi:hypothetical protein
VELGGVYLFPASEEKANFTAFMQRFPKENGNPFTSEYAEIAKNRKLGAGHGAWVSSWWADSLNRVQR